MLQRLRNLEDTSKRKIVIFFAGAFTIFVFIFWIFNFSGSIGGTLSHVKGVGGSYIVKTKDFLSLIYSDFATKKNLIFNKPSYNINSTSTDSVASTTVEILTE